MSGSWLDIETQGGLMPDPSDTKPVNLIKIIDKQDYLKAWEIYDKTVLRSYNFESFYKRWKDSNLYFVEVSKRIVGFVLCTARNEIGYFILKEYQRNHYGKKAVLKLMDREKRRYYWALTDLKNHTSIAFIQSLGFMPNAVAYSKDV